MIDIIIPVYNTPLNDLQRCLNSILNQTFNNYKVYIIDDGSNTTTKEFINKYIKNKNNFIVKHIKKELRGNVDCKQRQITFRNTTYEYGSKYTLKGLHLLVL